jgi:hypothetical protein
MAYNERSPLVPCLLDAPLLGLGEEGEGGVGDAAEPTEQKKRGVVSSPLRPQR